MKKLVTFYSIYILYIECALLAKKRGTNIWLQKVLVYLDTKRWLIL